MRHRRAPAAPPRRAIFPAMRQLRLGLVTHPDTRSGGGPPAGRPGTFGITRAGSRRSCGARSPARRTLELESLRARPPRRRTRRRLRVVAAGCALLAVAVGANAQTPDAPSPAELADWSRRAAIASLPELRDLLSVPNDAHFADQVEANVRWAEAAFARRGFRTRRLDTGGPPLLLAELPGPPTADPVLVYLQMDGQPVDSAFWRQPSPYRPTLKREVEAEGWVATDDWASLASAWQPDWRVFARSASDAKGPVAAFLAAVDALRQNGRAVAYPLKVILDFEEELGSPHLPAAVARYRRELAARHLVIFDGPQHPSNRPTLAFGARGIVKVTLETFGPRRPQHSGHYGNYVPNPAWDLVRLLAPLKDGAGRVTLPGWYDGIALDEATRAVLAAVPDDPAALRLALAIGRVDSVGATLQEALQYPSLNIRGLQSGWVREERRTIIPSTAIAEIDVRTVLESDPARLTRLLRDYVEAAGWYLVEGRSPTPAERAAHPRVLRWDAETNYLAYRTELDSPTGRWLRGALTQAHGEAPVQIRTMGGSIPISPFVTSLGVPAVSVPTVNGDNNQHSPNENLRLGNYEAGIRSMIAILAAAPPRS